MKFKKIIKTIEPHIEKAAIESVEIIHAIGRVCAKDIFARIDIPSFSKSNYDGFIIHREDYEKWLKSKRLKLTIVAKIGAGHSICQDFEPGTTYHVMTGAELPKETKYVIPYEMVDAIKEKQIIIKDIDTTANTVKSKGSIIQKGQLLLEDGTILERENIFKLADQGFQCIDVYKKPLVSIISTGDEIIDIGKSYERGKIYNSTSYAIAADVLLNGGQIHAMDHVNDDLQKIIQTIGFYLDQSNIIITTGGLGDGHFDYTKDMHKKIKTNILFEIMDQAPRIIVSKINNKWIINCSGTPKATFYSLDYVIKPIIKRMLRKQ